MYVRLSVYQSVYVCMSICPSVCLSVSLMFILLIDVLALTRILFQIDVHTLAGHTILHVQIVYIYIVLVRVLVRVSIRESVRTLVYPPVGSNVGLPASRFEHWSMHQAAIQHVCQFDTVVESCIAPHLSPCTTVSVYVGQSSYMNQLSIIEITEYSLTIQRISPNGRQSGSASVCQLQIVRITSTLSVTASNVRYILCPERSVPFSQ